MTERWLPVDEWDRVAERFTRRGVGLPNADLARIRVTEDDGRVVAMLVLQYQPHAEPIEIDPEYRGRIWWPSMLKAVEAACPSGVFVFAPNDRIAGMATSQGLTRLDWAVYRREAVSACPS